MKKIRVIVIELKGGNVVIPENCEVVYQTQYQEGYDYYGNAARIWLEQYDAEMFLFLHEESYAFVGE